MKITACTITLKENLIPNGATVNQPAWLRAKASVTLDGQVTLHGLVIRDGVATGGVFVTYPKSPVITDQYEVSSEMREVLEAGIILAYQRAVYPWLTGHLAPLHPLSLEILSGLREYYDYAADLYTGQRDVDDKVVKLLKGKKDWDQDDYEKIKSKVEPILEKLQNSIPD
jgi:DNA-binding cell septation regulator SpoVG